MNTLFTVLIIIASILLILAVLAQSPKSGMAANFGASNQVMGVRQTADFLEKSTWTLAIAILVFSFLATMTAPKSTQGESNDTATAVLDNANNQNNAEEAASGEMNQVQGTIEAEE